jgi:hypothetical protein
LKWLIPRSGVINNPFMQTSVDIFIKIAGVVGIFIALLNYRNQVRIKRAELAKSLYEKFFENNIYKEVRVWLDYGHLHARLTAEDEQQREINEEKFTDFLNFFEFISVLYTSRQLTFKLVYEVFDYYLKKIKTDADCKDWIERYSFEKLKILLKRI